MVFGQQVVYVDFIRTLDWGNENGVFSNKAKLISDGKESLYLDFFNNELTVNEGEGELHLNAGGTERAMVKNYEEEIVYYENMLAMKFFPTKEDFYDFEWEIEPNKTKDILGFTCQAAVANFRGRTYVVYFTDKIGINGGPWKFDGLPGMILKVNSTDGVYSVEANSIEVKNSGLVINNTIKTAKNLITYDEFVELYRKKYKEENRTEWDAKGGMYTVSMPKCQIECFVD